MNRPDSAVGFENSIAEPLHGIFGPATHGLPPSRMRLTDLKNSNQYSFDPLGPPMNTVVYQQMVQIVRLHACQLAIRHQHSSDEAFPPELFRRGDRGLRHLALGNESHDLRPRVAAVISCVEHGITPTGSEG